METRVAVVGAGIAGIAAAYQLRNEAAVTLFEAERNAGGHAHTVAVADGDVDRGLDTAFIVYNNASYPRFAKFLADLGVESKPHPGRFSFTDHDTGVCYVSEDFELPADEISRRYPPEFAHLAAEADRFHRTAPRDFIRKRANMPLGAYLAEHGYSDEFKYGFVVLLASAIWSVPPEGIWDMPASTIIAFFLGHGYEGLGGRTVPWRTVANGSASYVRRVLQVLRADGVDIRTSTPIGGISQLDDGVTVSSAAGPERFDYVVLATHADDALALIDHPTPRQRLLEAVAYSSTRAVLHTDTAVLPRDRDRWRSWNYARRQRGTGMDTWVSYYLNRVQDFASETDYFVSIDCPLDIAERDVIAELEFRHPVITMEVQRLQSEIASINNRSRIKFAGSYIHSRRMGVDIVGGHESAFDAGFEAADSIRRERAGNVSESALLASGA